MFAAWYGDSIEMIHGEKPSFYDWRHGTETLNDAMTWPIDGILFDIEENDIWLNSWGVHPDTSEERRIRLLGLVHRAPALIPLTGHRYLLGTPFASGNPVLSVYQSDIICYGSDLRHFLILELCKLLKINHNEAFQRATEGITQTALENIPFWEELMSH